MEDEHKDEVSSEISSKKLKDLGFNYKHGIEDIIHEAITYSLSHGFLPPLGS